MKNHHVKASIAFGSVPSRPLVSNDRSSHTADSSVQSSLRISSLMKTPIFISSIVTLLLTAALAHVNAEDITVDFAAKLQPWHGFGVNYVETAQTRDYDKWPQDFGGFSKLTESQRHEFMNALYGPDGLGLSLHKIFLDPWAQATPDAPYDFERTTQWSRWFLREAMKRTTRQDRTLRVITTLYGPPAWATKQKKLLARDFDPAQADALARYMAAWVGFLEEKEGVQAEFLSLSNEAKDASFFTDDGMGPKGNSDYNLAWKDSEMTDMMKRMHALLPDVGFTPTEPTGWDGANYFPFMKTQELRDALGIITAHSFGRSDQWGPDFVKKALAQKRGLPVWTTSHDWRKGGVDFAQHTHAQIYKVGVNGIITWQVSKNLSEWRPAPKNPNAAIMQQKDGGLALAQPYYFLKQMSLAGQPGMSVVDAVSENKDVRAMAFASNGTKHPDAIVIINASDEEQVCALAVSGTDAKTWKARRTTESGEHFIELPPLSELSAIQLPQRGVLTLFANSPRISPLKND